MKNAMIEVALYRSLILDHMEMAGIETKNHIYDYENPEDVKKAVRNIGRYEGRTSGMVAAGREKKAFWLGQLYVLDWIAEFQKGYTMVASNGEDQADH
ncbi:MAG: hypothetical protein IJH25_08390 [Clostridia bacterium]|nr:hypothetical protein [Clostridia bacterium]MBQ6121560.1 hypothetical protein [Clostridia bacterium]